MFYSEGKACSALLIAAYKGNKDIVELLITNGASINVVDGSSETPLHKASSKGHQDVVEFLITNGAQINAKAKNGCTPLYMAASCEYRDIAKLLLSYGAAMEPDIAVMLGDIELVKHYLSQGVDANSKLAKGVSEGNSWLITAIGHKYKNNNLVKLLLDYGAKVNEKTGTFQFSPLHRVAIVGYKANFVSCLDIGELLVAHGADVNAKDKHSDTPLHWAARLDHQEIVEFLVECGANVNILNQAGSSALFDAVQFQRRHIVECLLSHEVEVNLTDDQNMTPLLRAFQRVGNDEVVKLLVAYGANVNIRGCQQESTPIHLAVAQDNKNIVEFLLANGAREGLN